MTGEHLTDARGVGFAHFIDADTEFAVQLLFVEETGKERVLGAARATALGERCEWVARLGDAAVGETPDPLEGVAHGGRPELQEGVADRPGGDDWGIWDDLEREHDGSVAPFRPSTLQEFDQVCRLEMVLEVLDDAALFVFEVLLATRHVALLGEDEEVDIFVRFGERAEESRGVPELYVLVDHAVDDEQATLQLLDVVEH